MDKNGQKLESLFWLVLVWVNHFSFSFLIISLPVMKSFRVCMSCGDRQLVIIYSVRTFFFNFIALGRQHTNLTTHTQTHNTVTTTPLVLAADASLTRWTVIDGGMYHPPSHCLRHTTLMKYAGAQKYSHSVRDTNPYIESHILQGNKRRYFIHQYSSQLPQIWYVNIRIYLIWKMQNTLCAK